MDIGLGGFTESDQTRIAEEVQARVRSKRTGLGFGFGVAPTDSNAEASLNGASSGSSNYLHGTQDRRVFATSSVRNDTTKGEFPWDSGDRSRSEALNKTHGSERAKPRESQDEDRPREREFPMIRDRDIERNKVEHERLEMRPRERSRSRSEDRKSYKSRWRQKDREKEHERRRDRDRYLDREKEQRRDASKERYRVRGRREKPRESQKDWQRHNERTCEQYAGSSDEAKWSSTSKAKSDIGKNMKAVTILQAKSAVKRKFNKAVAGDASLRTGFKASSGGGGGWERPEMADAAEFFKQDEIASKGGMASVAPEFEARIAQIRAVEDEDTVCLGDRFGEPTVMVEHDTTEVVDVDSNTNKHFDAIFAPTGSLSQRVNAPTSSSVMPRPGGSSDTPEVTAGTVTPAISIGAAERTRLVLKGKVEEASRLKKKITPKFESMTRVDNNAQSSAEQEQGQTPLFKTLKSGDVVEARYSADDMWYSAVIVQVIHGGFEIARCKVRYTEYGNEETLAWRRIRWPSKPIPTATKSDAGTVSFTVPVSEATRAEGPQRAKESSQVPTSFAGLRPRSVCVEKDVTPTQMEQEKEVLDQCATTAEVVNPTLLTAELGRKMTWKEKLQARKSEATMRSNNGGSNPKKQVSLVPDFGSRKREEGDTKRLDGSMWRSKVTFGIKGKNA